MTWGLWQKMVVALLVLTSDLYIASYLSSGKSFFLSHLLEFFKTYFLHSTESISILSKRHLGVLSAGSPKSS